MTKCRSTPSAAAVALTGHYYVDVKTTKADDDRVFHVSLAELRWASEHTNYLIARITGAGGADPEFVLYRGLDALAQRVLEAAAALPDGVRVDSINMKPELLDEHFRCSLAALLVDEEGD